MVDQLSTWLMANCEWFAAADLANVKVLVSISCAVFALLGLIAPMAGIFTWLERRVSGRIQHRQGPNRVGPFGLLQFLADGVKLLGKEDIIPDQADGLLFRLAPYLTMLGMFAVVAALPLAPLVNFTNLNVGALYILAVGSFATIGIIMAGWSSNNKWSLLGGMRSAAQIISYEIPLMLSLVAIVLLSGTLNMHAIVHQQAGGWGVLNWNVFSNPFVFIGFVIFFIAAVAENNRLPFDLPEAESELVSGFNTEYSGMRFALFFLAEFANMFIVSAITVALFLGGWVMPASLYNALFEIHPLLAQKASFMVFFGKSLFFVVIIMVLRWTLPRLRVDQLMHFCWKFLTPIAFVNVLGTAIWVVLQGQAYEWFGPLSMGVRIALFIVGLAFVMTMLIRINWLRSRMNRERIEWIVPNESGGKA